MEKLSAAIKGFSKFSNLPNANYENMNTQGVQHCFGPICVFETFACLTIQSDEN